MSPRMKALPLAIAQLIASGAISVVAMAPAIAQTPSAGVTAPTGQPSGQPIRIEVTGSNIPRTDTETPSPVQVLTAEDLARSGYTTVSEVLRDVTANGQGLLSQGFNGAFAGGASGVALRGLSVGATLVLVDGRRMVGYPFADDNQRTFVDVSSIPLSAIERVEILLDGASAIYGSDAIGGVVNFILRKNFTGTQLMAEGGITSQGDGGNVHLSMLTGFGSDGPVNGILSVEYRHNNAIKYADRSGEDWANMNWAPFGGNDIRPGAYTPGFMQNPILLQPYLQNPANPNAAAGNIFLSPGCTFEQRNASQCVYENTWSVIQPETTYASVLGSLNGRFGDGWEASLTGSWFDSRSEQNRRPFAVPLSATPNIIQGPGLIPSLGPGSIPVFRVSANYPGNTFGVPANVRAFVPDIQNQHLDFDTQTWRVVGELTGTVAGWDVNIAAGYQKASTEKTLNGYVDYVRLLAALNDPVNPLKLTGGNSPARMADIAPEMQVTATNEYDFVEARVTKELMKLDGGPLGLALGGSYYYQKLNADNPAPCKDGSVAGVPCFYGVGNQSNTAFYAEVNAPVIKTVELNAAVRYDYYDTYGGQWTPKFGAKWTPMKQLAIRGTWGQGFRAPNIYESGDAGTAFSAQGVYDPLNCPVLLPNGNPDINSPQNVPFYCSFSATFLQSTTKDLQPEKSDNWTIGLVLEPIQNWSTTVDYYSIELKNQIIPASSLSTFDPLTGAVRGPRNEVTFGDGHVGLSPAGIIVYIPEGYVNAQTTTVTGLDLGSFYTFKLNPANQFKVGVQWSHIFSYDLTFEGRTYDLVGTHGPAVVSGNTGNPQDRLQLTGQWTTGPWTTTLMGNYISGYSQSDPSSGFTTCAGMAAYGNPSRWTGSATPPADLCNTDSFWYWNLNIQYQLNKQTQFRFAVTNLFNQQAPLDIGAYAGTGDNRTASRGSPYNPSLHWAGVVGTSFLLGVTYNF